MAHILCLEDLQKREHKLHQLNSMVKYCLAMDCRRKVILQYFGEEFDLDLCQNHCDSCLCVSTTEKRNASDDAIPIVKCLQSIMVFCPRVTCRILQLTFWGSKRQEVVKKGLDNISEFGIGKRTFTEKQAALFIHKLITLDILQENIRDLNERGSLPYITLGSKDVDILSGKLRVTRQIR